MILHFRTSNPWVQYATTAYWSRRLPQVAELERIAAGHDGDESDYYARHERITFRDTLIRCSTEWRQMKESAA